MDDRVGKRENRQEIGKGMTGKGETRRGRDDRDGKEV